MDATTPDDSPRSDLIPVFLVLFFALGTLTACGSGEVCSIDEDCFRGELCSDGACVIDPAGNADTGTNSETTNNNTSSVACVVDPIGNSCNDDGFEPNNNTSSFAPLLWDNQTWCDGSELLESQTSDPLTLCAGDELDVFRLMVDNRTPDNCITQQSTWTIDVRFDTACEEGLVNVQPYFSNPRTESRCLDGENFRCSWSDDRKTFTIEHVRQPEQLMDINLLVESAEPRDDVQVGYEIELSIVQ